MAQAKVTFTIPAYNVEKFLRRTVESVQQQTFSDWKMIIIDDCSTDDTLSIANSLAKDDPRISVVRMSTPSGGAYLTRLKGIKLADTEFIAPLDADDRIGPDYLEVLLRQLEQNEADLIYPTLYFEHPDGRLERHTPTQDSIVYESPLQGKDCVKFTLDGWRIGCGGGILRRSVYLKAVEDFGETKSYPYADELHSRYLLLNARKVVFSEQPYYYFINPASITHAFSMGRFTLITNNIELCCLTHEIYGTDSEEYLRAQRQNFHTIFDLLKYIRTNKISREQRKEAFAKLSIARSIVNFEIIKGKVSPRLYMALRHLPLRLISLIR